MMIAVIAIATSTITGILASTYIIQQANVQNQTGSLLLLLLTLRKNPSSTASPTSTGPISFSSTLSRTMHLRYIHFLSNAISVAEKTVAANSHTTYDRLMLERRFLVYAI